jgi:hypothetical protein
VNACALVMGNERDLLNDHNVKCEWDEWKGRINLNYLQVRLSKR